IQTFSLTYQRPRRLKDQLIIFAILRVFDVALTTAAATAAAAAAGAHAAGAPLTPEILRNAAAAGALKSGLMAFAGLIMLLVPQKSALIILPVPLGTTMASNVVLMAAISTWILGHAPTQLLVATVVASVPLTLCLVYYYGAFKVPVTVTSIPLDVLGAYTFVKMADNLGYPICPTRPAMVAGAILGTVFSASLTLLNCFVIGKNRIIYQDEVSTRGWAAHSCCGNWVSFHSTETEYYGEGETNGCRTKITSGTVRNSYHGLGIRWDSGVVYGGLLLDGSSSKRTSSTQAHDGP
ncbi:uncharacterized protein C8A04DRAFT_14780, partial [Dichotomopilus funicola]